MPRASRKTNARRSRTFGGCATCRRRHVKCDLVKPTCLTCKAVGVTCDGFSNQIRWMPSSKNGNDTTDEVAPANSNGTSRRHLYTESHRERMSSTLAASVPVSSIDASLAELDHKSKKKPDSGSGDVNVGPFGVLSFTQPVSGEPSVQTESGQNENLEQNVLPESTLETISPITLDSWAGLDDTLQWADLFGLSSDCLFPATENLFDPLLDLNTSSYWPGISDDLYTSEHTGSADAQPACPLAEFGSTVEPGLSSDASSQDVLVHAQSLLKHFRHKVIPCLSSLPVTSKSPLDIVVFTEAVSTLSHMTWLESPRVSCAKRATLFVVLAISASHMRKDDTGQDTQWHGISEAAAQEAKRNLQTSLKNELTGRDKAKYKDQLMAILGLLVFAAISGHQKDARYYLLDAERLMRHRGLAKREVSRKSRLLHHLYTWYRLVGESTYVLHEYADDRSTGTNITIPIHQPATHSSGPGSKLDDFLRLQPQHLENDAEIMDVKEPQASLRDIHLEDSRENTDTYFNLIWGISETWLSLLSQTTRLANCMDFINTTSPEDAVLLDLMRRRSARLEDMICSFASEFNSRTISHDSAANHHMHCALNSALVIFFYRRIRNVNPWILQSHVDDVIKALAEFDRAISDLQWQGVGVPWPAFMAGCEAISPEQRGRLMEWIEKGETSTGFNYFIRAKELLLEVWRRKDETNSSRYVASTTRYASRREKSAQSAVSWVDVCREQKVWLMAF